MGNKMNIAIAIRSFAESDGSPLDILKREGWSLRINQTGKRLEGAELSGFIKDCDAVIAGTEKYTAEVLAGAGRLKVISRVGIGTENVDQAYARSSGIKVLNTPDSPSYAVAEHTVALILALLKNVPAYNDNARHSVWKPLNGYMLKGRTVGVVGYGRIGRKVAALCIAFGCKVIAYDPYCKDAGGNGIRMTCEINDLLRVADIVTLHVPGNGETRHLISKEQIGMMKPGSYIVNTSRGEVLDEEALYAGLKDGRLAGTALDVFEKEPYQGPLLGLDSVIVTPHVASNAREARAEMEMEAVGNLMAEIRKIEEGDKK